MLTFSKLLLVLAWMALIFVSSHITFPDSDPDRPKVLYDYIFDKDMHILLFGVLAFLWCVLLHRFSWKFRSVVWWALFLVTLYGVSDEYHQSFVAGREASIYDLVFDVIGAFGGIMMYWVWTGAKESVVQMKKHAREIHVRV